MGLRSIDFDVRSNLDLANDPKMVQIKSRDQTVRTAEIFLGYPKTYPSQSRLSQECFFHEGET